MVKILTEKIQSIFPNKLFFAFIRPISPVIKENVTIHHKKFTKIDITHCLRKFKCDRILSGGKNDRFRNN